MIKDLNNLVIEYAVPIPKTLCKWINKSHLSYPVLFLLNVNAIDEIEAEHPDGKYCEWEIAYLSANPAATHILEANIDKINWGYLASNPNALHLLANIDINMFNWYMLSRNPAALDILEAFKDKIIWAELSRNPNPRAIQMLESNPTKIDWCALAENTNPRAIQLLEDNAGWQWYGAFLSGNPSAIHIIEKLLITNPNYINWAKLSRNPAAIHILEANTNKIDYHTLGFNPNAIHLIKKIYPHISHSNLSTNPSIYVNDLVKYKEIKAKYMALFD